ncbi:Transposon Ty3-I Gag-Pol polyprotein [Vitis vinifera]|uniref:Transposon Ty3-I Gag-Pol polyprotein n=1 Tax=Vitis vinifera TaxID=29760 RepID=A0A438E139_VITVI|nr:Transposon Ty3-I Gag-Pol polyprotein [Vitis vinifera]
MHGVPVSIVSDRDPQKVIQVLEGLLRACILDLQGNWDDHLPLVEFAYNNSFQASIGMAPFEALYGRKCRSPICWNDVGERKLLSLELVQLTVEKVALIKERLKAAQSRHKSYADHRRRDLEFEVGDHVFLKVSPMKSVMRFGRKGNLVLVFWYIYDPSHVVELEPIQNFEDLTYEEVQWSNHSIREATWELEEEMREKHPQLFQDSENVRLESDFRVEEQISIGTLSSGEE